MVSTVMLAFTSGQRALHGALGTVASDIVRPHLRWALNQALPSVVMHRNRRRGDLQAELFRRSVFADGDRLEEVAAQVRASGPLHRARFAWLTARQPVVKEVLTSHDFATGVIAPGDGALGRLARWSQDPTQLGPLNPPSLLVTEPPAHTRYRRMVSRVFSARAVEQLRGRTEEIAGELLDDLAPRAQRGEEVDLVAAYCSLLPVTVIAEVLGVPPGERQRVLDFGAAAAPSLDVGLGWREFRQVEHALKEFDAWLVSRRDALRAHPGHDLLSRLVAAREDGVGLDDRELRATAGLVLAAGFETTVNLLGNGVALLDEHPAQRDLLRAQPTAQPAERPPNQPDLWANAVDEVLRYDPPVLLTARMATRDTEVAGQPVAQGEMVTTLLAGANRDPDVFTDPNRFDVTRPDAREHVAFSAGRHHCLGAALARMEGEVGLRMLYERYPDLQVLPGGQRRSTRILRGYETLPVRLGPPA